MADRRLRQFRHGNQTWGPPNRPMKLTAGGGRPQLIAGVVRTGDQEGGILKRVFRWTADADLYDPGPEIEFGIAASDFRRGNNTWSGYPLLALGRGTRKFRSLWPEATRANMLVCDGSSVPRTILVPQLIGRPDRIQALRLRLEDDFQFPEEEQSLHQREGLQAYAASDLVELDPNGTETQAAVSHWLKTSLPGTPLVWACARQHVRSFISRAVTRKLALSGLSHDNPGVRLCAIALIATADEAWHSDAAGAALHSEPDIVLSQALHAIWSGVSIIDDSEG